MIRIIVAISLLFISTPSFSVQYDPKIRLNLLCYQTLGKNYYSDSEVGNIKIYDQPLLIKTLDAQEMLIQINSKRYYYISGVAFNGDDGVQRFNLLFRPKSSGLMATETASIHIYNGSNIIIHLIFTEPLMGNRRSFVRTSFYNCKGNK